MENDKTIDQLLVEQNKKSVAQVYRQSKNITRCTLPLRQLGFSKVN